MIVLKWLFRTIYYDALHQLEQLGSQDAATPIMQGIIDLHHDIFFFLILILVFVLWILVRALWHFHYKKNAIPQRIVHGTTIEILRTIFPSIISMFIAIPSFALVYAMDMDVPLPLVPPQPNGSGSPSSSEWFTYTSNMVEESATSTSSVNQPMRRDEAGPSNALPAPAPAAQQRNQLLNQPFEEDGEGEARAQEHARVYAQVERINLACENLQAAMLQKAYILLEQHGIALRDPQDVKRALQAALHDDWDHDIDERKRHFTALKRHFGTHRCERWNTFIDELRGLGNPQVNARHYVD